MKAYMTRSLKQKSWIVWCDDEGTGVWWREVDGKAAIFRNVCCLSAADTKPLFI
jgi:hypothetical protein